MALRPPEAPRVRTAEAFAALRTDVAYWRPYVEWIAEAHGLGSAAPIVAPKEEASNACLLVNGRWFVKILAPYSNFRRQRGLEVLALESLQSVRGLPVPALVASGALQQGRWPYLVQRAVRGVSLVSVWESLSKDDRLGIASQLGRAVRRMHDAPIDARLSSQFDANWSGRGFRAFLGHQRRRALERNIAGLSDPVKQQALDFLSTFVAPKHSAALLHGDLTNDNLLVRQGPKGWTLAAILDFGDVKIGDPAYDVPALLAAWSADRDLLDRFLHAYGWRDWDGFRKRAMAYTLLHEWDVLPWMLKQRPELADLGSIGELTDALYGVER